MTRSSAVTAKFAQQRTERVKRSNRHDVDIAIIGAGCAGLSLAVQLVQHGLRDERIVLFEPREAFETDRTWCFFRTNKHPFARCVDQRWHRWTVHGQNRTIECGSVRYPYEHLPSGRFYETALEILRRSPNVELRLGTSVNHVDATAEGVRVSGTGASEDPFDVHSQFVFDSRPDHAIPKADPKVDDVLLLQHFAGWVIETERPIFDPSCARLMDFEVDQSQGVHFMYVLPFSKRHALIEDTFFSESLVPQHVYADNMRTWLERHGAGEVTITRREEGVIPMTSRPHQSRPHERCFRIGTAGGLARPATGYAFLNIQRHAQALAEHLLLGHAEPKVRSARTSMLDRVFLSYLARHPERGAEMFVRLFDKTPTDALVRFLSETNSPLDDARVMAALPALPLMTETLRSRKRWLGRGA